MCKSLQSLLELDVGSFGNVQGLPGGIELSLKLFYFLQVVVAVCLQRVDPSAQVVFDTIMLFHDL
jgi:hypothetical protein